jgi:hypothetical protein
MKIDSKKTVDLYKAIHGAYQILTVLRVHHEFISENSLKMTKKHHEIYFSDFRKVAPDKFRTILR